MRSGRPDSSVSGAVAFGLAMDGCADLTAPQHANSGWGRMKLESYLNEISDTTIGLGVGTYAFRGQGKAKWPLHSAATRRLRGFRGKGVQDRPEFPNLYLDYHKSVLIDPARTQGLGIELGREISDLQLLAKLQHLGAATGLLDFSWNPLVGLWFACENPGVDGKLFAINVNDPIQVAMISNDESEQSVTTLFLTNGDLPNLAYWEPMASGDAMARILRQRSVFIIGRPTMTEGSSFVGEITIAKEDKRELIRELSLLDVSHRSLFLDAHGFAEANHVKAPVSLSQDDYLIAGNRYYQQSEYQSAIEAYGRFIQVNPNSSRIYFLKGNAHAELNNHAEAIEDYDRAIVKMDQTLASSLIRHMIYVNRANSKAELGNYGEALQDYLRAIGSGPGDEQYQFNLANTYADLFCFEEAISAYEKVMSPNWHSIFNKGNALMCLGRFREAFECYIQAAAQASDNETVNQNIWTSSRLLNLLGDLEYTHHLDPSRMHLQICVTVEGFLSELSQYTYIIAGRVGNFGFTHPGGQGFPGKGPITISLSACE